MNNIPRWEHNCEDYKNGTLNFCSACEYYQPVNKISLWQKIKNLIPLFQGAGIQSIMKKKQVKKVKAWAVILRTGIIDIATPDKEDAKFLAKQIGKNKVYPCEIIY